jgi:hypothetical protein
MRIAIASPNDIAATKSRVSWLNRPTVDSVEVLLPTLTADDAKLVAKKIRNYFNDCGCIWATAGFLAAIAVMIPMNPLTDGAGIAQVACVILAPVLVAVALKFTSLAWSYRQLRVLLDKL